MYNGRNSRKTNKFKGETMNLPEKFQFRVEGYPGFTHSAKVVGGTVTVKWARGWHLEIKEPQPWRDVKIGYVEDWVAEGGWIIVDENKKVMEKSLPEKFDCVWKGEPTVYHAKRQGDEYVLSWGGPYTYTSTRYEAVRLKKWIEDGIFQIYEPKQLTPEQLRRNKEIQEQLRQLDSSIKIAEQTIEHHKRLIASYEERKEILKKGLVEE